MTDDSLIARLAEIVGSAHVRGGGELDDALLMDWTRTVRGAARAAVFPANTEEVAQVLAFANRERLAVVPQGGNTGMSGGAVPLSGNSGGGEGGDGGGIILGLKRLHRVRALDGAAQTITVEAGCVLVDIRRAAADAGLFFPLALGAEGSCQIGGNLATNAGGLNVLRYGSARDLCMGVEAVLADGRIWHGLSGLHKNNSGYDLRHLLIGSEGTLAVITAATLKLLPPPRIALTAWATPPSPQAALELLNLLQHASGGAVTAFELLPESVLTLLLKYQPEAAFPFKAAPVPVPVPWAVLLEAADCDGEALQAALMQAQTQGLVAEVVAAQSEAQRAAFWRLREETPMLLARRGRWYRTDIALPLSALPAFIDEVRRRVHAVDEAAYMVGYGHVGDGNLHVSVRPRDADPQDNPALTRRVAEAIYRCVAEHGGSFSAEHGIGQLKTEVMRDYKDATALAMMRAIKNALDENGILNPGKLLP